MPSFSVDAELPISAPRLWKAMKDVRTIIPKIAPEAVSSMEHVDGPEGAVGAVTLIKFGTAVPAGAFAKEKLIALDHDAFSLTNTEVEGGHFFIGFTKWETTIKFVPISDSSCKFEGAVEYEGEGDVAVEKAKEGMAKLFGGIASYVNATGAYA